MALNPKVIIDILANNRVAKQVIADTESRFGKAQGAIRSMALPAAGVLGGIGLAGAEAVESASKVEQSFGALESVFKGSADEAKAMAKSANSDVGLATSDYAQLAATLGAQLKNLGTAPDDILTKTDELIGLGSDLAAQFGGSTSDAVAALSSLLRGERDPIERYGVSIKQSTVDAYNLAQGVITAEDAAKKQAKANADVTTAQERLAAAQKTGTPETIKAARAALREAKGAQEAADALAAQELPTKTQADNAATLALLTQQTADAQGAFGRETDTAAHAQQVANAKFEDAKAALGVALLPIVVLLADKFAELADWISQNTDVIIPLVAIIGGFAAAILAANLAIGAYNTISTVWRGLQLILTSQQLALNAAMLANPIGLIVLAILALVAAFILAYNNSEEFRRIVDAVFAAVADIIGGVVDFVVGLFTTLVDVLEEPFTALQRVVEAVMRVVGAVIGLAVRTISGIFTKLVGLLTTLFGPLAKVLTGPFETAKKIIGGIFDAIWRIVKSVVDKITGVLDGIADTIGGFADAIDNINPFGAAPASGVPVARRPAGLRAASRAGVGGRAAGPITVNVYTTGDSLQAEQAVVRALRRQTRLNGGVVPAFGWGAS